jgi:hypothetical protein
MNYCDLDDAFQIHGAPEQRSSEDSGKIARKEERRKAKRCKGPAATYLNINDTDPDRQNLTKSPMVPAMNPVTGLKEHVPVTAPQGDLEPFQDTAVPIQSIKKKFFGADPAEDSVFADYLPDSSNYQLQPDFLSAFEQAGVARAGSAQQLPNPSVNMYWKPLSTAGAQTSFIEKLPPPGGKYFKSGEISMEDVMRRVDSLFAKLDDMNQSTPEQVTSELLMFISTGIFVLFVMDLLVKKGRF